MVRFHLLKPLRGRWDVYLIVSDAKIILSGRGKNSSEPFTVRFGISYQTVASGVAKKSRRITADREDSIRNFLAYTRTYFFGIVNCLLWKCFYVHTSVFFPQNNFWQFENEYRKCYVSFRDNRILSRTSTVWFILSKFSTEHFRKFLIFYREYKISNENFFRRSLSFVSQIILSTRQRFSFAANPFHLKFHRMALCIITHPSPVL